MHGEQFFFQAFVYLTAAVVSVPIAKRFGLGSVLGYLLAGIVIGPSVLGLIGKEGEDVMHFAEFGVVMMLFLVGLELQPSLLWRLRGPILVIGGLQVAVTTLILAAIAFGLGVGFTSSLAIGMILALSSTAIVLQTLNEKGLMKTDSGQTSFAVLLFQDLAVIPMLALLPLLATKEVKQAIESNGHGHSSSWVAGLPGWGQTLVVLGVVVGIILVGKFIIRYVFRFIARARIREVFTAAALLIVIGIALLMTRIGLSPALGTFLAGVVLADSEYRHELECDIEPFKGLLLGLFFIAVGASINFDLILSRPGYIFGVVAVLILVKFVVLFILGKVFKMGLDQNLIFAFGLAQGGEFAFVLFSFALQNNVLTLELTNPLVASVAISMAFTPLLMLFNEKVLQPNIGTKEQISRPPDQVNEDNPIIIAGYGRFGNTIGRLLDANGIKTTVLDNDSDHVELLRKFGSKVFYGDATRVDLLKAAGAAKARVLIIAIDDHEKVLELVELVQKNFPKLVILARASSRNQAYDLLDAGVKHVYREMLDSSLMAGIEALRQVGVPAYGAWRSSRTFRRHDEELLKDLGQVRHDNKLYINQARQSTEQLENIIKSEQEDIAKTKDEAWDSTSRRVEFKEKFKEQD